MTRTVARLAAVASASVTMLAVASGAAVAGPPASVHLVKQATLQEDGTVAVSFTYRCNPAADSSTAGTIFVGLGQREPSPVRGQARATAECDGEKHQVTLDVGPGPFSPGSAEARALVLNSDRTSFAQDIGVLKVK